MVDLYDLQKYIKNKNKEIFDIWTEEEIEKHIKIEHLTFRSQPFLKNIIKRYSKDNSVFIIEKEFDLTDNESWYTTHTWELDKQLNLIIFKLEHYRKVRRILKADGRLVEQNPEFPRMYDSYYTWRCEYIYDNKNKIHRIFHQDKSDNDEEEFFWWENRLEQLLKNK